MLKGRGSTHAMIPAVFSFGFRPYSRDTHPPRLPPPTKTLRLSFNSGGLGLSFLEARLLGGVPEVLQGQPDGRGARPAVPEDQGQARLPREPDHDQAPENAAGRGQVLGDRVPRRLRQLQSASPRLVGRGLHGADGSFWAVQEWQRKLPDYGLNPTPAERPSRSTSLTGRARSRC